MKIKKIKYPVVMMVVFIWIGFICSISFMEAWLKFRAMYVTRPIGLSIGRVIFDALNKVEWAFAFTIIVEIFLSKKKITLFYFNLLTIPVILLFIQTFLMLPALNERVDIVLLGNEPPPSLLHFYYLTMELIKVGCLFIFGLSTFRLYEKELLSSLKNDI